ncbi:hypothetical protein MA9V1_201 [Chryseobacterium phage MA9V-1]|nr:hypothetical protein MA9V1_201 [Chryseobacterium phage MA9V-1]
MENQIQLKNRTLNAFVNKSAKRQDHEYITSDCLYLGSITSSTIDLWLGFDYKDPSGLVGFATLNADDEAFQVRIDHDDSEYGTLADEHEYIALTEIRKRAVALNLISEEYLKLNVKIHATKAVWLKQNGWIRIGDYWSLQYTNGPGRPPQYGTDQAYYVAVLSRIKLDNEIRSTLRKQIEDQQEQYKKQTK